MTEQTPPVTTVISETNPSAPSPKPRKEEKTVTLFGAVLMQILTLAAALSGAYLLDGQQQSEIKIVSADTASIINAKLLDMQDQSLSEDDFRKASAKFMGTLLASLNEYKAAGYTVINDQAVIASPKEINITRELATAVGVNPNALSQSDSGKLGGQ